MVCATECVVLTIRDTYRNKITLKESYTTRRRIIAIIENEV